MDNTHNFATRIQSFTPANFQSPIKEYKFVDDNDRIVDEISLNYYKECMESGKEPTSFELAGPREKIYFDTAKSKVGLVTCGGLCPGLNNVIRSTVLMLYYIYGVRDVIGFRYGYKGLVTKGEGGYIVLTPEVVSDIHDAGGSILSSSRGMQDVEETVNTLDRLGVNILFTVGGDGTLRGAHDIAVEVNRRGLKISVIGIPKTIDNDISFTSKSFGFETAFSCAVQAVQSAHVESNGAENGIGLVKLMGRHSGFLAANASLAQKDVNFCLVPEIDFDMSGEDGLLNQLKLRLIARNHAVIVVAEGAGQKYFKQDKSDVDASGNIKLHDIGTYLQKEVTKYFKDIDMPVTLKYIDPSYIIRSVPAIPGDRVFCGLLSQNSVHAAMVGKTDMIIGLRNNRFVHVPIKTAIKKRKNIEGEGILWQSVVNSTGQPPLVNRGV